MLFSLVYLGVYKRRYGKREREREKTEIVVNSIFHIWFIN